MLDRAQVEQALGSEHPFRLKVFEVVGSTNDFLFEQALAGAPAWTVAIADRQTRGKGRMGRRWESPSGVGLWFSVLLRPKLTPQQLMQLNLVSCLAVAEALESFAHRQMKLPLTLQLKWPNDVYLAERKLSGILLQSHFEGSALRFLVLGIGVNVNQTREQFPQQLRETAISLRMATGRVWPREVLFATVLKALYARLNRFEAGELGHWREAYLERVLYLNQTVHIQTRKQRLSGQFVGITREGFLILRGRDGDQIITAGDVLIL
ncbi:MAG: biotin--[acetyl-CoA-carboxylase] ligase [Calditrichaeota bacterium]|nr:MAG: biotin--[acetyl-CoA-carboxylase] ligase [Calditrichota bacterium]